MSIAARRLPLLFAAALTTAWLGILPAAAQPTPPSVAGPDTALTIQARRAGVEKNNAPMGWKFKADQKFSKAAAPYIPTGVLGIDVSSYQGNVNWASWVAKGKTFAYIKATQGTSYRSPYFSSQYTGAYQAGMTRGAYHFANPGGASGKAQARYFVAHGGAWSGDGKTLPGVLDIEYNPSGSTCYGISQKKMVSWIRSFTREYKKLTTRDAVIYTTGDWWTKCTGNTTKFVTTNPLWAARWGSKTAGTLPGGWKTATFWQYSDSPIDQDRFSSTPARLKVLATGIDPLARSQAKP